MTASAIPSVVKMRRMSRARAADATDDADLAGALEDVGGNRVRESDHAHRGDDQLKRLVRNPERIADLGNIPHSADFSLEPATSGWYRPRRSDTQSGYGFGASQRVGPARLAPRLKGDDHTCQNPYQRATPGRAGRRVVGAAAKTCHGAIARCVLWNLCQMETIQRSGGASVALIVARSSLTVRFDPEEIAKLDSAAQRAGLPRSAYIRDAALVSLTRAELRDLPQVPVCEHGLPRCFVCRPHSAEAATRRL